jgi:UDP-glucuronate decarboxylase
MASDSVLENRLAFSSAVASSLAESDLDVIVTGARGWLGRATLEMLESVVGDQMIARVHVFGSTQQTISLRSGRRLDVLPLAELSSLVVGRHLFAHYAFATRELVSQLGIETYIARNREITEIVADHLRRTTPAGLFVTSSGAVYLGAEMETNPYGVLKTQDEQLFLDLAVRSSVSGSPARVVIPRLFNLAGPFLNKPDRYVLGSVIEDIFRGGPIRLKSTRPVVRSYVHVVDLVDLAFAVMTGSGPVPDEPFDTAGEREIEVGELAEMAISVLGCQGITIERPPLDGFESDRYVGDPTEMRSLARAYGVTMKTLSRQIEDTALFMKSDQRGT